VKGGTRHEKTITIFNSSYGHACCAYFCAKQPTQEMNDSKAAIDAVLAEGGEKYANEEVVTERSVNCGNG
jgi:hypothetical protein